MLSVSGMFLTLAADLPGWLYNGYMFVLVLIGFSIIIFVHELGHFVAAKSVGIRVDRFAVGFGPRLFGYRRGEGFTLGRGREYKAEELRETGHGETDYCFKALPLGGYVKMLGQDDVVINEQTGEVKFSDDPRAFTNRPVGQRMIVVSAGVISNVLFAAVLLMTVFLLGKQMPPPVIGIVGPEVAAQGNLLPGDRVLEINGHEADSFNDLRIGAALAKGTVRLKVERNGKPLDEEIVLNTTKDEESGLQLIDVEQVFTPTFARDGEPVDELPCPRAGDEVIQVDGRPVKSGLDIYAVLSRSGGGIIKFTVRRRSERDPQHPETVECYQRAVLAVLPADLPGDTSQNIVDNCHILGLERRRVIGAVEEGKPAAQAGFRHGDVVAEWGGIPNPTYEEITTSIQANPDNEITVVVERNGEPVTLKVRPARPFKLIGQAKPRVGLEFSGRGEEDRAVVADVAPGTPFAALQIPRGAVLTAVDGRPVGNWFDVVEALMAAAGRTIEIRYRSGSDEVAGQVSVPSSLVNELGLAPGAIVWSVDGEKTVEIRSATGEKRVMRLPNNSLALRALLATKVGQTVEVRYSPSLAEPPIEKEFTVRADNLDPWQMRIAYVYDRLVFAPAMVSVTANGNPIKALKMGAKVVGYQIWQVYMFLTRFFTRHISPQSVAGPVGIISMAMEKAKHGPSELLFFLAFLSVNLAVINFLPMPVMDGGLMVFLIIEKIKGKPISFKAQMISTMVGLVTIILIGLFVTVQDIGRLF